MHRSRKLFVLVLTLLIAMLLVVPSFSQSNGNGKGKDKNKDKDKVEHTNQGHNDKSSNNNGHGKGNNDNANNGNGSNADSGSAQESIVIEESSSQDTLLGCQKNNPDRLDCSSLEVSGYCDGTVAVFTIRNTGESGNGDMRASTSYSVVVAGETVQSGNVQLSGGATMQVTYDGGGTVTLYANQQVGHPGKSHPQTTLSCGAVVNTPEPTAEPTVEPTEEATIEPTEEVTVEPTEEVLPPAFEVNMECNDGGFVTFFILNIGGDMLSGVNYEVIADTDNVLASGWLELVSGEEFTITVEAAPFLTLWIDDVPYYFIPNCGPAPTEEATPEPTEEPQFPGLDIVADCLFEDVAIFTVTWIGPDMLEPMYFEIVNDLGEAVESGDFLLVNGQSINLYGSGIGLMTLLLDDSEYASIDCFVEEPTEEPTIEPTVEPTEEPTIEPTEEVTVEPTEEATVEPTEEPTVEPTPDPTQDPTAPLGCQKNNPDRLDCSSLQVSGYCDGSVAVFTIRNTGEPGNGDMRAPTSYSIVQDGMVIQSGDVSLLGHDTMEVRYDGGGTVTLYALQQVGHPGKSYPRSTLSCG